MKRTIHGIAAGCLLCMAGAAPVYAQAFMGERTRTDRITPLVADRLEVGVRIRYFRFVDPERATVGADGRRGGYAPGISTYTLKEQQSFAPWPFIRYHITPYIGVQLSWERLEGETGTRDVDTRIPYDHSNGNPVLRGPGLTVYGRVPLERVVPYAGLGLIRFSGTFDHDPDWHAGGRRNMAVRDTTGYLATAGASLPLGRRWAADLSAGFLSARPKARYWMRGDSRARAQWEFPMDSWTFQAGLNYAF